jgi:hypothetical protein
MDPQQMMYGVDVALLIAATALVKSYIKWFEGWKTLIFVTALATAQYYLGSDSGIIIITKIVVIAAGGDTYFKRIMDRKAEKANGGTATTK